MRNKCLLFLILVWCCSLCEYAQGYYFRHLGVADGLSQVCITAIGQDETGAIWLGTTEGLNRYNGRDIRVFRPSRTNEGLTNNDISELCPDTKGNIYIRSAFDLIRFNVETETFTCLRKGDVKGLFSTSDGTLWAGCGNSIYTVGDGTDKLSLFTQVNARYGQIEALWVERDSLWVVTHDCLLSISRTDTSRQKLYLSDLKYGKCILKSTSGDIWVGSWNGVYRIMSSSRRIVHYPALLDGEGPSDAQVRCIVEDDFGQIWIGTYMGLDCCRPTSDGGTDWKHYTRYGSTSNVLSHHSVLSLYKDYTGNIWVGTFYGGANIFNPNNSGSHFYEAELQKEGCLSFPVVGRMTEDKNGNIWACTEGGGLNCLHGGKFTTYTHRNGNSATLGSNTLKSVYYHPQKNCLYVGTHLGGLFILDCNTGKGHSLHNVKGDASSLPHEIVNEIQPYKEGLAILTQRGPAFLNLQTEKFSPLTTDVKLQQSLSREYQFETFLIDSKQRMWLALASGGVLCVDLNSLKSTYYAGETKNPLSIGKFRVVHIFEDCNENIYFCSIGAGLFRYIEKDNTFKPYNRSNDCLPSDYCYYICNSADKNHLYILHREGVSLFNCKTERTEYTCHRYNQTFSQSSSLYFSKEGTLYVAGTNGLASYSGSDFKATELKRLSFDRLFVMSKEIVPGDKSGILDRILNKTSSINLSYKENNLSIEFADFDYSNGQRGMFEYKLDGFDRVWTQTSGNMLTYTSLPPGNYVLRVHPLSYNSKGNNEIKLAIHISAPFYLTGWAYCIYALCMIALLFVWFRFKTRQAVLRSSLSYERKEKERIEELNSLKLRFFTNISHEFRTPLSLIVGQIEMILNSQELSERLRGRMQSVYRNAWHMRNLISELLDFRKQEQGFLNLKVEERDFIAFIRQIYQCFSEYALQRHITYNIHSTTETLMVWFDPVQMQKVVFNLLSNAFKYTPEGGTITVEIRQVDSKAVLSISDTGVGIPEGDLDKIFNSFYRVSENASVAGGSGIGLALAQGIMNLHHGHIDVKSRIGEGTLFTLTLQLGNNQFREEEIANGRSKECQLLPEIMPFTPYEQKANAQETESLNIAGESLSDGEQDNRPVVLLVEDNLELLSLLKEIFSSDYIVYTASDGEEGLEKAHEILPNLVVSDVMMPKKSGIELCKEIKESVELSHISVVLLTARVSEEYMVDGFMYGADDYIPKPFSVKILLARCGSILANKKRLQAYYDTTKVALSSRQEVGKQTVLEEKERKELESCVALIRANFENAEFRADDIAAMLNISRSTLYKRFNKLVGMAPNEFILKVKFDESMTLLKTRPDLSVTDIALSLGFSSQRYFSRSFKAFFGVSPQNVRNSQKQSET